MAPKITQAMIKAYDDYTHLTLDRRSFMEKMTKLAGSGAAAASIVPLLAAQNAAAQIVGEDDDRLVSETVTYQGAGGSEMSAYLAMPADAEGPLPAVMVIHENRGLNAHIRDVARRAALEGFVALAPDFLALEGGTPEDEDQAREMIGALDPEANLANGVATLEFLAAHDATNGNVGAVGFCWGGGMVNALAVGSPELDAGVAYYGRQPPTEDVPNIEAPLMLHYAGLDERINAGIKAYAEALQAAGKRYTIHVYDDVNHAFNNDTSAARYDEEAATLAWQRTIDFLKDELEAS